MKLKALVINEVAGTAQVGNLTRNEPAENRNGSLDSLQHEANKKFESKNYGIYN